MNPDVARSLTRSATAFREVVWPHLNDKLGPGDLVTVESVTETGFAADLDLLAGIDAWMVFSDRRAIRSLATRVQFGPHCWRTWTIRSALASGGRTELHKRTEAINRGYLYPELTVQAYVHDSHLIGAGVIHTVDLIHLATSPVAYEQVNSADGNRFIVVDWDAAPPDRRFVTEMSMTNQLELWGLA